MTSSIQGEVARGRKVVLREKRVQDAADDYRWRTDEELVRFDAARPYAGSFPEFVAFFQEELTYPNPYRRSLAVDDLGGRHIGNVMYYNIDVLRQEVELGITIGEREYWNREYGTEAVQLLVRHMLGKTSFRRVHLKTLSWNFHAQRCFEKAGFRQCGRLKRGEDEFLLMELRREWLAPEYEE